MGETRIVGGIILAVPPCIEQQREIHMTLFMHPYLFCYCGHRIYAGFTSEGAPVYGCIPCNRVADQRHVP